MTATEPRTQQLRWVQRVDREAAARPVLGELALLDGSWSFVASADGIGVEQRYEELLDLVGRRRPRTDRQALVAQVRLVQEWRRFPLLDPGLPRELLPPRWSGNRAAEVFRERHAAWAPRARRAWAELTGRP
jgi:phenylacetic acid degradation operon negative regulatory protein